MIIEIFISLVVIKKFVRPFKEPDAKGRARQAFFFAGNMTKESLPLIYQPCQNKILTLYQKIF
jgi:hypothetical protein